MDENNTNNSDSPPVAAATENTSNNNNANNTTPEAAVQQQQQSPSSDSGESDMSMLMRKCSICFDNDLDFCLLRCQDQFCRDCFGRYVHEIVKNSWGMADIEIKCPACNDPIRKDEWWTYVRSDVRLLYERNNRSFKTIQRCCPICQQENPICERFESSDDNSSRRTFFEERICRNLERNATNEQLAVLEQIKEYFSRHMAEVGSKSPDDYCETISQMYQLAHDNFFKPLMQTVESHSLSSDAAASSSSKHPASRQHRASSSITRNMKRQRAKSSSSSDYDSPGQSFSQLRASANLLLGDDSTAAGQSQMNELELEEYDWELFVQTMQQVSRDIISLELSNKGWRRLQFLHLSLFPSSICSSCRSEFCFHCGEAGWHTGYSCLEWMAKSVAELEQISKTAASNTSTNGEYHPITPVSPDGDIQKVDSAASSFDKHRLDNLKWKLENSKACPRCFSLICRDEGCNKVDCTMCGHKFCWVCRSTWSEKCGFYKCKAVGEVSPQTPSDNNTEMQVKPNGDDMQDVSISSPSSERKATNDMDDHAENGVPNIQRIRSRLSSISSAQSS